MFRSSAITRTFFRRLTIASLAMATFGAFALTNSALARESGQVRESDGSEEGAYSPPSRASIPIPVPSSVDLKNQIKLPCGTAPFAQCAVVQSRVLDGKPAATPADKKVLGFRDIVRETLDDIYAGKTRVNISVSGKSECSTFEAVGKPPVCPPLKISENSCKDESKKNSRDEACGKLSKIGQTTADKYYYSLATATSGSLETANIAGGMVLAVSNQSALIEAEIQSNTFTVVPTSPCYTLAQALKAQITAQTDVKLIARINETDVTGTDTGSAKKYFEANLATIEAAYTLIAKCRLVNEAQSKFREFASDYPARIENIVVKACFGQHVGNPANFRACYDREYNKWLRRAAKSAFPAVANVCGN